MSETQIIKVRVPSNIAKDFFELVERCYSQENPSKKDLKELRRRLADLPELYRVVFDISDTVQQALLNKIISNPAAQAGIEMNIKLMQQELGFDQAPALERMIINSVLVSWLNYQWAEIRYANMTNGSHSMSEGEYWTSVLNDAQRRYLRACQTLAKIRKLARNTPALQVNIATQNGQQVNIAGDFVKK